MLRVRRVPRFCACLGALALALSLTVPFAAPAGAADPAAESAADSAAAWLRTQQEADGGFEVAGFPGFETRDASLAIAAAAQSGGWNTTTARSTLAGIHFGGGAGPTPLNALDAFAATVTTAGGAAKTIVLSAAPLGLDPAAFDAAGDGGAVNLEGMLDAGCGANTASFGTAFNDTLYSILAKRLPSVCGVAPPAAVATVRAGQQANGGWSFTGDPSGTDVDIDTSALAVQALVAGGAGATDPDVHEALVFLSNNQQATGAWQSFGADDPNSTALAMLGITAAGYDVTSPCWRDTATPTKAGTAYSRPDSWLISRQQGDGRIASPNDGFGINTFATAQAVQGLLRSWLPTTVAPAQTCPAPNAAVPTVSTTTPVPIQVLAAGAVAPAQAVVAQANFTG